MPAGFNGSGTYLRAYNWEDDKAAGTKIQSIRMDEEMDGFASGLSLCILRNGTSTVVGDIPMNTHKFTGMSAGTVAGDSVRYEQAVLRTAPAVITTAVGSPEVTLTLESTVAIGPAFGPDLTLSRNPVVPAIGYGGVLGFDFKNSLGVMKSFAAIAMDATTITSGAETGELEFALMGSGSFIPRWVMGLSAMYPAAGVSFPALGSTSRPFSTLYLATASGIMLGSTGSIVHAATGGGKTTFSGDPAGTQFQTDGVGATAATFLTLAAGTGNKVTIYKDAGGTECGSITVNSDANTSAFVGTSDGRMKPEKYRRPLDDSGEIIDRLRPLHFQWRESGYKDFGFIAQELAEVLPTLVVPGDDGDEVSTPWMAAHGKMEALLVAELQSLRSRVASLEAA